MSDREIKQRLDDFRFECDNLTEPFRPEEQIQPSSIDLRLDATFWLPRKSRTGSIDLRRSVLLELSPRRYWKQRTLSEGEAITLQPGKLVLGRVYEKFTMPRDCAGNLEPRSSFARMGLGVQIGGNFVNPGWRGHMPLQLVNYGNTSVRIFPYIPICQLLIQQLSSEAERPYGERELQSKYMDDDGGPSYWWRDKRIRRLQEKQNFTRLPSTVQELILSVIGAEEPDIVEDFDKFVSNQRVGSLESASATLELFSERQENLRKSAQRLRGMVLALFPILAGGSIGALFLPPFGWPHYMIWGVTVLSFVPFWLKLASTKRQYFDKSRYQNWEASRSQSNPQLEAPEKRFQE